QLLADVVVQLAGDVRPLALLRLDQPRAEIADAIVARAQALLTVDQPLLGTAPPATLHQQARNQRGLREEHDQRGEDVRPIALEDRRFAKEDRRRRRYAGLAETPPSDLTPVDLRLVEIAFGDRNGVGRVAAQDTKGGLADGADLRRLNLETAANDA